VSTYLAVGSVCWDEVPGPDGVERRLGGSVLFSARVAVALGWQPVIVTSGTAMLEAAVRAALPGVEVVVQRSAHDTVMRFGEQVDLGPRWVPTVADPIDLGDAGVDPADAQVVHLAPIMGEVTPNLVEQVRGTTFVGLTPQGLLRRRDGDDGRLALIDEPEAWWARAVDAAVLSESEHARFPDSIAGPELALAVTRGEHGCFGHRGASSVDLPGVAVDEVALTGTIGAGDVFAASLFVALAEGQPFSEAMDLANRTAAAHVAGDLVV
jgi:hypothetical protein